LRSLYFRRLTSDLYTPNIMFHQDILILDY